MTRQIFLMIFKRLRQQQNHPLRTSNDDDNDVEDYDEYDKQFHRFFIQ